MLNNPPFRMAAPPALLCSVCDAPDAKLGTGCETTRYCGKECQTGDWREHKKVCGGRQRAEIRTAFSKKPFPDFKTMEASILEWGKNSEDKGIVMKWWSEYNPGHHERLRSIYNSYMDKNTCVEAGRAINAAGGFEAMQACFYILANWSGPPHISILKHYWDGIGEWAS